MQSIIKKCILISFLILAQNSVFALFIEDLRGWLQSSTTSIVCAANKKDYHWLENETVHGYWGVHTNYDLGYVYHYFYISEGSAKYNELKEKCIEKFGTQYVYPQPADYSFSDWYPFAKDQVEMFPSVYITKTYINFKKTYIPK